MELMFTQVEKVVGKNSAVRYGVGVSRNACIYILQGIPLRSRFRRGLRRSPFPFFFGESLARDVSAAAFSHETMCAYFEGAATFV